MTFHPDTLKDLTGKVYIVTGANSGMLVSPTSNSTTSKLTISQWLLYRGTSCRTWCACLSLRQISNQRGRSNRQNKSPLSTRKTHPPPNRPHVPLQCRRRSKALPLKRDSPPRISQQRRYNGNPPRNNQRRARSPMANKLSRTLGLNLPPHSPHAQNLPRPPFRLSKNRKLNIFRPLGNPERRNKIRRPLPKNRFPSRSIRTIQTRQRSPYQNTPQTLRSRLAQCLNREGRDLGFLRSSRVGGNESSFPL